MAYSNYKGKYTDVAEKLMLKTTEPKIFAMALERFGVGPERALHLGDTVATDVDGARSAGVRVGLIDPWAHYDGMLDDVPVAKVRPFEDGLRKFLASNNPEVLRDIAASRHHLHIEQKALQPFELVTLRLTT